MLKEHIESELKSALKAGDELKLSVLRMVSAAIHNKEIEERTRRGEAREVVLGDAEVVAVVRAEVKKRKDAAAAYAAAGRSAVAERETREAEFLGAFLPQEISDGELEALVAEGRAALGAAAEQDFGKLMGWVMGRVKGRAAGERVATVVRKQLAGS